MTETYLPTIEMESKAMRVWEEDLSGRAENTKRIYHRNLKLFLDRWDISPENLYEKRLQDLSSEDPRDRDSVERMLKIQMAEMEKSGKSPSTIRQLSKALASFFDSQRIPLNIRSRDQPKGISNGQRLALKEDILKMYDSVSSEFKLRNRAALFFLKDSGLRISDVNTLNVGDWMNAETRKKKKEPFKVFDVIQTQKNKTPAFIIVGPEAVKAVDEYLEQREARGLSVDPDSPLFPNRDGERFNPDGFGQIFIYLGKKIGRKGISAHSLRKYHTTQLQSAGIVDSWIKKLQGKAVEESMRAYTRPEETGQLLEAYVKAYSKLQIFTHAQKQIEEIEQENERLRKELEAQKRENITLAEKVAKGFTEIQMEMNLLKRFIFDFGDLKMENFAEYRRLMEIEKSNADNLEGEIVELQKKGLQFTDEAKPGEPERISTIRLTEEQIKEMNRRLAE